MCRNSKNEEKTKSKLNKNAKQLDQSHQMQNLEQIASEGKTLPNSELKQTQTTPNSIQKKSDYTHKSFQITRTRPEQRQCLATLAAQRAALQLRQGLLAGERRHRVLVADQGQHRCALKVRSPNEEMSNLRNAGRRKGSLKSRQEKIVYINPWGLWSDPYGARRLRG